MAKKTSKKLCEQVFPRFVDSKNFNISKFFQAHPNASKRIQIHPDASKLVQMHPNRSEQVQKPPKICGRERKNFKQFANNFKRLSKKMAVMWWISGGTEVTFCLRRRRRRLSKKFAQGLVVTHFPVFFCHGRKHLNSWRQHMILQGFWMW